jgi:hypothetical protein
MFGRKKKKTAKDEPSLANRRIWSLESQLALLQEEVGKMRTDYNLTDHEFDQIRKVVIKLKAAAGGFWRTASGHVLRIRDMSTDHIKRCLAGNFGGPEARHDMELELDRRKEEDYWRSMPMPVAQPPVQEPDPDPEPEEDGFIGLIYGVPLYVDKNTPPRIMRDIRDTLSRKGL